jgi:hypothetical protein
MKHDLCDYTRSRFTCYERHETSQRQLPRDYETPNEETEEEQDTLLAAVTGQICESLRTKDDNESEDYDDDDDDDE